MPQKLDESRFAQLSAVALAADPPSEIEVILSGSYKTRNFVIDDQAIDSMIANHVAAGVDPAVDREHESWSFLQLEPSPAMGWVKSLSKRPSTIDPSRNALVAHVEWTDVGQKAVAAKHYRYISAGIDLKAKDRLSGKGIGMMLDHVALVKHPFVQGMQPLSLAAAPQHQENIMNPALLKALGLKEDADEAAALSALGARNAEIEKLRAESGALKAQNSASEARLAALEADAKVQRLARLEEKLDAKIAAFAIDAAEKPALMKLAAASPESFDELISLRQPRDPSGPKLNLVRSGATAAASRLSLQTKAIEERMKATGETYDAALIALATEQPEFFAEVG